ncbi:MAG: PASTA domain-containing protein [Bacteroidota bacterium]
MKILTKKIVIIPSIILFLVIIVLLIFDNVIMPSVVESSEVIMPNVVGLQKEEAIKILEDMHLTPIEVGPRFDSRFKEGDIIFQKPYEGVVVKENRRVYIHVSGGEPLIQMPQLVNKTLRDGKITIERLGLTVGKIAEVRNELPNGYIVEQEFDYGFKLEKGETVDLKVSIGPQIGMVRVPNLIAKSEKEAEKILRRNNLILGNKTFLNSPTLLPNTIISQYPSQDALVETGSSIDVVIAKNRSRN